MKLKLGKFCVEIIDLVGCFSEYPHEWNDYIITDERPKDGRIVLSKKNYWTEPVTTSGWFPDEILGQKWETFYSGKGPQFSLLLEPEKKTVHLCIRTQNSNTLFTGLQYAIMAVLAKRSIGLHGVTVICRDQVITLVAPSGTGKTTLARLLCKFEDAAIVNGDFAFLSFGDGGKVYFEPTMFCGTSKIGHNVRVAIDKVVFLEQAEKNEICRLNLRERLVRLNSNIFFPEWDNASAEALHENAMKVIERVPMFAFGFKPEKEAAEVFYDNFVL